jgi:hypothetical protein
MTDAAPRWPFLDPPNTAVFTNLRILDGTNWVRYVTHDEEDGAWQFHPPNRKATMSEAAVVSLANMLRLEPRIAELADLPTGWHAWRDEKDGPWQREPRSKP